MKRCDTVIGIIVIATR